VVTGNTVVGQDVVHQPPLPIGDVGQEQVLLGGEVDAAADGLDNAEIAAWLCLSEKTVRNYITRLFDKICVEHRYQAIVLARDAGLGRGPQAVNSR